jgi:phosphate transport system substrate-binding protein
MRRRLAGACIAMAAVVAIAPAAASARPVTARAAAKPKITMSGSTSVAPLAAKLIKAYIKKYPKRASFTLAQGGSDVGVADIAAGRVSIGNSSRDAKPSDPGGLHWYKIARDAICLATHKSNTLANLSQPQVQDIFSGKIRDWSDVPGATITGPIDLVVRTPASGTQDAFQKLFMGDVKVSSTAAQKASNGLVKAAVGSDKNAIGYLSYAFTKGLHDISYKGVQCSLRTAKAGTYPGSRNFWMITRGTPKKSSAVAKFIRWVRHNKKARKIISSEWVPLS